MSYRSSALRISREAAALTLCTVSAFLGADASNAGEIGIIRDRLPNGVAVVAVPDARWPLVHLEIRITPGALADPSGRAGTAALTAATLMESTVGGNPLSDVLDFYGTEAHVQPSWKDVRITAECLSSVFPDVFKAIAAAITHPSFGAEPLARARGQLLVEIRIGRQNNLTGANEEFRHLVYAGRRLGDPAAGTPASLSELTSEHLSAFYNQHYRASALTIVVAGQVELATTQKLISDAFGNLKSEAMTEGPGTAKRRAPSETAGLRSVAAGARAPAGMTWFIERDIAPPQVRLGQIVPPHGPADDVLTRVLNHIFGGAVNSRLMKIFREQRAMTYGIGSELPDKEPNEPFMMWTFTEAPKLRAMIEGLRAEVRRLQNEPVSDDELNAARKSLRNGFLYAFETAPAVANLALEYPTLGIDRMKREYLAAVDAITPARLQRLARTLLDPDRLDLLVVGREREVTPVLEQLGGYKKVPPSFDLR